MTRADVDQALAWLNEAGSGMARVQTADTDFSRFPGVRWKNPLL